MYLQVENLQTCMFVYGHPAACTPCWLSSGGPWCALYAYIHVHMYDVYKLTVDEPEPDDNLTYAWNEETESWDSTPR